MAGNQVSGAAKSAPRNAQDLEVGRLKSAQEIGLETGSLGGESGTEIGVDSVNFTAQTGLEKRFFLSRGSVFSLPRECFWRSFLLCWVTDLRHIWHIWRHFLAGRGSGGVSGLEAYIPLYMPYMAIYGIYGVNPIRQTRICPGT